MRPALNRVERDGETLQLEPRIMDVLVLLAARPNEVLSRDYLFRSVWPDAIVCEEALTRTISELRRVFRDDPRKPRVIETIRKRGYRLLAAPTPASVGERPSPAARPAGRGRVLTILGVAALAGLSLILWRVAWSPGANAEWHVRPLTSDPGMELYCTLSPDGASVAFSWAGPNEPADAQVDLYVMPVEHGAPVRLTGGPLCDMYPAWSPDGTCLAYVRGNEMKSEICTIPAFGGIPRVLLRAEGAVHGLDWSPDGTHLTYAARAGSNGAVQINLLSLDSLEEYVLTAPPSHYQGDLMPAFSPDGGTVAFIRMSDAGQQEVQLVSVSGGEARTLALEQDHVAGIDWISDRELILSASPSTAYELWRVALDSGERHLLTMAKGTAISPSVARGGERLVYSEISYNCDIWRRDLDAERGCIGPQAPLISSTRNDHSPRWSPDGSAIAFVSDRSGASELWVSNADGSGAHKLTNQGATSAMSPRWSPDGKRIAYAARDQGSVTLYVTDVDVRLPRAILKEQGHVNVSLWSPSGEWIYYRAECGEGWETWRVDPNGGTRERIAGSGYAIIGEDSAGDGSLLCLRSGAPGVWSLPAEGGEAKLVFPGETREEWTDLTPAKGGFYFLQPAGEAVHLGFFGYASEKATTIECLDRTTASLALAPDGRSLLYYCVKGFEVDVMLADCMR